MTQSKLPVMEALSVLLVLASSACSTPGKRTAIGAGAGAATGATAGAIAGGWKGAAIGGIAGAATGGAIGNYLDKQANELKHVADTRRTEEGILVNLKNDLLFETGSAVLKKEAIENLGKLGDVLAKYKDDRIRIEGFTDSSGTKAFNEVLSMRRAEAVKNVLIGHGVKADQMIVLGYGKLNPIASNQTSRGRAMNRRVELHIEVPSKA